MHAPSLPTASEGALVENSVCPDTACLFDLTADRRGGPRSSDAKKGTAATAVASIRQPGSLALFPAITALVSFYGLFTPTSTIRGHLTSQAQPPYPTTWRTTPITTPPMDRWG